MSGKLHLKNEVLRSVPPPTTLTYTSISLSTCGGFFIPLCINTQVISYLGSVIFSSLWIFGKHGRQTSTPNIEKVITLLITSWPSRSGYHWCIWNLDFASYNQLRNFFIKCSNGILNCQLKYAKRINLLPHYSSLLSCLVCHRAKSLKL